MEFVLPRLSVILKKLLSNTIVASGLLSIALVQGYKVYKTLKGRFKAKRTNSKTLLAKMDQVISQKFENNKNWRINSIFPRNTFTNSSLRFREFNLQVKKFNPNKFLYIGFNRLIMRKFY
jgi:hypothetical protein